MVSLETNFSLILEKKDHAQTRFKLEAEVNSEMAFSSEFTYRDM